MFEYIKENPRTTGDITSKAGFAVSILAAFIQANPEFLPQVTSFIALAPEQVALIATGFALVNFYFTQSRIAYRGQKLEEAKEKVDAKDEIISVLTDELPANVNVETEQEVDPTYPEEKV